ncbi:MAG: 16S rRNA (guanine(966)-N(2))-methyltransferase RsmD [Atopostipes suicloacalis]|nr:16S rRNA (guanine(966)-N(2))-methyltransferase RsmD [Atopostipes suicloacalis]MDN6731762.1 16S rRNA (guanine(966)-N(2))-methyltransferase RsmD [Atopostipes suicloacalis]
MRVISGDYGGRPLQTLAGKNTRPTSDRLKETIFNIIGPNFKGGNVLDLYAGTGSLGIEAVSRGMDKAIFVDSNRDAVEIIKKNIAMTKEENKFEIIASKADYSLTMLASRKEKFSLIFLDPPYAEEEIEKNITNLVEKELLADIAVIVCEVGSDVELANEIAGIDLWDQREYRNKKVFIYQK